MQNYGNHKMHKYINHKNLLFLYNTTYNFKKIIDLFNLENNIIIFLTNLSFTFQYSQYILSDKEQLRAKKFIRERDRIRFKVAHTLKRLICSSITGVFFDELVFNYNQYNKPFLKNDPSISFNISHSGNWCGIAVSKNKTIGFDVQSPILLEDFPIDQVIHPEDYIQIQNQETGTQVWSIKEAVTKAYGVGLGYPFNKLKIEPYTNNNSYFIKILEKIWFVSSYPLSDSSVAAISSDNISNIKIFYLPEEIFVNNLSIDYATCNNPSI